MPLRLQKQIEKLPTVASNGVESMAIYLNENQTEKLKLIGEIKQEVAPLQFSAPDSQPVDIREFQPHAVFALRLSGRGAGRNQGQQHKPGRATGFAARSHQ